MLNPAVLSINALKNSQIRRRHAYYAVIGLALLTAACGEEPVAPDRLGPQEPNASATAVAETPFYFTQGGKVLLHPTSERVVVATTPAVSERAVTEGLANVGVEVVEISSLARAPGHHVVRIAPVDDSASTVLPRIRSAAGIQFAVPAFETPETRTPVLLTNWVNVRFKTFVSDLQVDSLANALGLSEHRDPAPDSGRVWHSFLYPQDSEDPLRVTQELFTHPLVRVASPGMIVRATQHYVPTDPYYSYQFNLKNPNTLYGVPVDINIEEVWDHTLGENVHVVVIDDGVDLEHVDPFDGDMELPIGSGLDFFADASGLPPGETAGSATDPFCSDNHGTQAAGMIKAAHNDRGVAGIAPLVNISSVRIFFLEDVVW